MTWGKVYSVRQGPTRTITPSETKTPDEQMWLKLFDAKKRLSEESLPITVSNLLERTGIGQKAFKRLLKQQPAKKYLLKIQKEKPHGTFQKARGPR